MKEHGVRCAREVPVARTAGRMTDPSLALAEASAPPGLEVLLPEQGGTGGVTLKAASEVDMQDQEMVLSIIVDAIQFTLQHAQKASGHLGAVLSPEERVSIARGVLTALSEQGFQVARAQSEPPLIHQTERVR